MTLFYEAVLRLPLRGRVAAGVLSRECREDCNPSSRDFPAGGGRSREREWFGIGGTWRGSRTLVGMRRVARDGHSAGQIELVGVNNLRSLSGSAHNLRYPFKTYELLFRCFKVNCVTKPGHPAIFVANPLSSFTNILKLVLIHFSLILKFDTHSPIFH